MGRKSALELASKVDEIYAAKGQKVVHFDMKKDKPSQEAILGVLLGPTGNLRAPAIVRGRKLLIGFNEDAYNQVLN